MMNTIREAGKVLDSQLYSTKSMYITEDREYYYPFGKEKKDGVKVFGGMYEMIPNVYLNYLLFRKCKKCR